MKNAIERFLSESGPADDGRAEELRRDLEGYVAWRTGSPDGPLELRGSDDVEIRSYLLQRKLGGADRQALARTVESLRRFYDWAEAAGLVEESPFSWADFDRPLLDRDQIRRRRDTASPDPLEREVRRLDALNRLAADLNRSVDVRSLMDGVVRCLAEVMGLSTAWSFFAPGACLAATKDGDHDYAVASGCGLPPALESNDRLQLRAGPDCMCQGLFREGRLVRAVNIVECTRLRRAPDAAGDKRGLKFHASVPLISGGRKLGLINVATSEWELLSAGDLRLLSAAAEQVAVALERARLFDIVESQRARLELELEMARSVQRSLLPESVPQLPGYGLAVEWCAARQVAGDFWDAFELPDSRWALVLADVSGKGAPAALYMAMARSLIRNERRRGSSPAEMLGAVHRRLIAESSATTMYLTAFLGVLDPGTGTLRYVLAGHAPPLLRRASGDLERLSGGGPPVGLFDDTTWCDGTAELGSGDRLLATTDGIAESRNAEDEEYGEDRLERAFRAAPEPATAGLDHVLADRARFAGEVPAADDITAVLLERE